MNDRRDQLYDNLINSGKVSEAEIGNRDEFKAAISDEAKTRQFYKNIIGSRLLTEDEIGSEDDFYGSISDDFATPQPQSPASGGGYQPSAEDMKGFLGTIGGARQTVGQSRQAVNRIGNMQQRAGLDLSQDGRIELGKNRKVTKGQERLNLETGKMESTYVTEAGNEYGNRELADIEQNATDLNRYLESVPGQLDQAYKERDRLNQMAEARRKQIEDERSDEGFVSRLLREAGRASQSDKIPDNTSPSRDWENDREYSDIMAAIRKNNELITTLEDQRDNATNGFWHSFGTEIANGYTFSLGGKARMDDAIALGDAQKHIDSINKKRSNGEELTHEEEVAEAVLKNAAWDQEVQAKYGDDYGAWARAGKMGANSADFMLDFLMMGGMPAGMAKNIMGAVVKGGERYLGNLATKGFGKFMLKATGATLGSMVAGAEITNTIQLGKTASDVAQSMEGDVYKDEKGNYVFGHYEEDENGEPKFVKGGNDFFEALAQAQRSGISENGSEILGTFLPGGNRIIEALGLSKISRGLTALKGKGWYQNYSKFLETAGFNGVVGEGLEEYGGTAIDALLGGDEWKNLADPRTHIDIWLGVTTMSGILNAPNLIGTGYSAIQYQRYKKATNNADAVASTTMNPDTWSSLRETIDNTDNANMADVAMSILNNDDLSDEGKRAAMNYIGSLQKMRGYSLGSIAAGKDGGESDASREVDEAYTSGYDTQEPDMLKQFKDEAQQSADNLPQYGEEFAKMVTGSQDPVATLNDIMGKRDIYSDEQIAAAADYFQKMSRVNGAMEGALDRIDTEIERLKAEARADTHQQTGNIIMAKGADNTDYYIIGGEIVTDPDTGITSLAGTGGAVVVKDAITGEISVKSPQEVTVYSMIPAEDHMNYIDTEVRNSLMQQADDDFTFGSPANEVYQLEDTVTLLDGDGNVIEGEIGMMPNAVDGVYVVYTPDGKALQYTADQMNRMIVNHNGMEVQRSGAQPEAQTVENQPLEQNGTESVPAGNNQIQPQPQPQQGGEQTGGEASAEDGTGANEQPVSALSKIPVLTDEKGKPVLNRKGKPQYQWHKASVEDAAAALVETTGGDMVMARDTASDLVKNAQAGLEKIRKQKPKGEDPIEIAESRMEIKRQEQEQQAVIKQWQDVNQAIQKQMRDEAAARQAEIEAAKSAEQKARETEEARIKKEKQDEQDRQRLREAIERDREKRNKEYDPLVKAREEMKDDPDAQTILADTEPRSLEEWVSSMIRPHSMLWQDASDSETGLQSELGLTRGDMQRMMSLLGTKESGAKPFGKVVLDIYEGLPDAMKDMYTDEDVRRTLLNLFNEGSSTRMMHLTEEHRIEEAREAMSENRRRDAEAEMDAWAEAYHLTPEERETFEDFMSTEPPYAVEENIINQIIADNEQNRTSAKLDILDVSGGNSGEVEGGEGQVRQATEAAGNGNIEETPGSGAEAGTGQPAPADNNVPGGELIFVTPVLNVSLSRRLVNDLAEAYASGDPSAIRSAAVAMKAYVDEGGDFENKESDDYFDYDGDDPKSLALQYKHRILLDRYLDEDEDQEYIKTGLKPGMRQIAPSEQLKPTDLRDATRVESPEIGVAEANARARQAAGEPQPIGTGDFGPIYDQFKGKPKEAIDFLINKQGGEAIGALSHKDVGDIDLVWGEEGTGHSDGYGLAKLLKYHPEVLDNLQDILDEMTVVSRSANRVNLESDKYKAAVRLTWNEHSKTWLLTIFEKKNSALDNTTDTDETSDRGRRNDTATPQSTVSVDKDTNNSSNLQEKKQESSQKPQNFSKRPGTDTPEGEILVKGGTILKNNMAGGDAVALILGSNIDKKTGKRRYTVEYYVNEQDAKERSVAIGDAEIGQDEMRQHLANGDFSKERKAEKPAQPKKKEPKRLVSDDKMEELRKKLLDKLNNLNSGIDPEMMLLGAMYAVGNIERGVTKFADYARAMIDGLNDKIRPYLKSFYNAVRDMPEAAEYASQMDDYDTVARFDVYNFDKTVTPNIITRAEQIVTEQKIRKQAQKIQAEQPDMFAGDLFGTQEESPSIGTTSSPEQIASEEGKVDTNPSEAQKEAGNYQKGHIKIDGYDITIENPKGSVRRGTDANGKPWETEMHNTYGYIRGTEGVDGDHIDVFLSDNPTSGKVYVVDQVNPGTKEFDEHKVMYGFGSEEEAREAYLANYSKGWKGLGNITEVSREDFKKWVESSHRKTKPFAEYKSVVKSQKKKSDWWNDPNRPQSIDPKDYRTYMTPEAKDYFAKFKGGNTDFTTWAHPNLAYITAAVWDEVEIPYDELKKVPEIIEAENTIKTAESKGKLVISEDEANSLAQRLIDREKARQERKALVIIGLPAGGKSSVFANPLSKEFGARIIDSDDVKPWLDGFDGGNGAGYVQDASAEVAEKAIDIAVKNNDNIIIPRIGGKSVMELSAALRLAGYDVQLYFNDVKGVTSIDRAASRFAQTGRYLSLDYLTKKAGVPSENFSKFAEKTLGGYLDEQTERELQNIRGRLQGLLGELDSEGEGLRLLRYAERRGQGTAEGEIQDALGSRGLSDEGGDISGLLDSPLFNYSEWKSNDVAFGEKPKEIWNSESGKPMPGKKEEKNNEAESKVSRKPEPTGEGTGQASGSVGRTGTEPGPESDRPERTGSGHSIENTLGVPDGGEARDSSEGPAGNSTSGITRDTAGALPKHNNRRNNVGERGKDYAPLSPKARFNANVEAIKMMRALIDNSIEAPTTDQMEVLRKYSGWGGMGTFFNDGTTPEYRQLHDLLSEEELNDAAMSINSAYYTPAMVIDSLWDIAKAIGFKGGNVLEGSAGIGNIIGQMPKDMSRRSNIEAVEIDSISGNILKLLYPDAKVHIQGFQDTMIPNGTVDLAVTNVPFVTGLHVIDKVDKDLSRKFTNIHDFCIAKNIRKLREGGIGIFITSAGTMDKSTKLREWIPGEGQADVVGAFRLNNKTFGGTTVTSDIIVVRKRVNGQKSPNAIDISKASPLRVGTWTDKYGDEHQVSMVVNDYFRDHPEMMAGEMAFGYEKGDTFRPGSYGLYPVESMDQEKMLADFAKSMEKARETRDVREIRSVREEQAQNQLTAEKEGRMLVDDKGRLCVSERGVAVPLGLNDQKVKGYTKAECFADYQAVQKAVDDVLQQQLGDPDDAALKPKLDALNKAYDKFTKRYGTLHKNTSISFLRNDIDFPSFLALENYSETKDMKGKVTVKTSKAPLFSQRVLGFKTEPKPKSIKDALIASIFRTNGIDLGWITEKLNESGVKPPHKDQWDEEDVRKGILVSRLGFEDPSTGQLEIRYKYLSGNVREKLSIAESYNTDGRYAANVEELRKAVPMDIPSHLIDFSIGSSWIPIELYKDYLKDKYDLDNVKLNHVEGTWVLDEGYGFRNEKNRSAGVYSEQFRETIYGHQLVAAALNNRPVKVSKQVSEGWGSSKTTRTVVDQAATQACAVRVDEIKDEFKQWAKKRMQDDPELAKRIEKIYNDKFNALVPMQIDDEFLPEKFDGANVNVSLYDHQKRGVMRGLTSPTMLAHEVGTGKSFTLISTAMEMRRLGTAKKPMIVVQNATVAQMTADAKFLYPNAKVLSLSEKDRSAEGRRAFYAKIKFNDWDLVIVPQSTFERIPDSPERELQFIQEKIDEKKHVIEAAQAAGVDSREIERLKKELQKIEEEYGDTYLDHDPMNNGQERARSGKSGKKKDAKREAASLDKAETKAKEMLDRAVDDVQYFDDLGVDALLVDEAHEYKHLGFQTSIGRGIKGIDPSYSKKCAGLYNKTRSVFEKSGWKNVVFATGTPISNTAAEIWTFMKYLMPADVMRQNDIYYFDDFVHNFGSISQMLEFSTSGKFKENTRFAAYVNKPELIRIWSQVADTVLTREVGAVKSKVPEKEGGKDQDVFLPQSPSLISIMAAVRAELERFENMTGKEKKENSSIPLTMYGIAKRAAIDPRLVNADAPDEPLSKTNAAVKEIVKDLKATQDYKGTVAVFCDNQNRKGTDGSIEFNIYDDMREKLIAQGVPADQIAIIRSGMSIAAKQKVFDAVNSGTIRVVLGSTQTLGTGVNMQERLHLLIHMDAPDRPMDYTQRNGRIERQGNLHKTWDKPIRIVRFGVEDSLDVTAYQRLKTKSGFIDSIMDGKGALLNNQTDRTVEEEEEGLFDNPVAVLSGSQYALKKNQAERELRKYLGKKAQWEADQVYIANALRYNKSAVASSKEGISSEEKKLAKIRSMFPDGKVKAITVEGVMIDMTKDDGAKKLGEAIKEKINDPVNATVKKLRENQIYNDESQQYTIELDGHAVNFTVSIYRTSEWDGGKMKTVLHKGTQYSSPDLESDSMMSARSVRDYLDEITDQVITGRDSQDRIDAYKARIERINAETEQMRQREGQPFQYAKELEDARKNVEEYTVLMKKEMEEKEAKYAQQQKEAEANGTTFDLGKAEDNSEDDDDVLRRSDEDYDDKVYSQAFKDYFGDWENDPGNASKVVDENGMPQILHHGTNLSAVNGGNPFWIFRPGSHFGTQGQADERVKFGSGTDQKKIYNVYLNIRNPKRVRDVPLEWLEDEDGTHSEWWEKQIERAKYQGYDGLVYLNEYEDTDHPADSWIAFYPEQIKSADENIGTYDRTNPDIRYRGAELFEEGQTFPINMSHTYSSYDVTGRRASYSTDLLPDEFPTIQSMLDAIRNQYPEYYVAIEDGQVRMQSWGNVMSDVSNARTKAKGKESYVNRKTRQAIDAVEQMAQKMNLDVEILTSTEGLTGRNARSKGFFNKRTHKITIVLPNHRTVSDVINTLLHEGVAHYGLRKMFGSNFDTFVDNVYNNVDPEIRARIDAAMKRNGWNRHVATEEYLARLAERTDFEHAQQSGWWTKIKNFFLDMLAKAGFSTSLSDNELRYILWRSYDNLLHPGDRRNIFDTAREIRMESRLGVGRYERERQRLQRTGKIDTSRIVADRVNEEMLNRDTESTSSQELLLSLSQKEGDERNEAVNELIRRVREGEARVVRMGQEMELDRENDAQIAGAILGGWEQSRLSALADGTLRGVVQGRAMAQGSQAQGQDTSPDSELPIISWARSTGHYYDEEQVKSASLDKDVYRSGAESRVYRTADGKKVIKFMETWVYYQNPLLKHIDDITLQNSVGFEHLNVLGYSLDKNGRLITVIEQDYIDGETLLERYLKENNNEYDQAYDDANLEIDAYLEEVLGLEYVEDEGFDDVHTRNGLLYKDIHGGNVIVDKQGNKHIIDCLVERENDTGRQRADGFSIEDNNEELYSLRTKEPPKKTGIGYKVFVLKNGQLYPPMVANPNGEGTPVGVWLDADAAPVSGTSKTGRPQVKAGGKGTQGGSGQLAYRPGWHLGEIPYALQFNRKDGNGERTLFPNNFVWAEVEYADDVDYNDEARQEGTNASGKYQHSLAGLKHVPVDGSYKYRTNPDPRTDPWIITGAMRVNRILSREEVNDLVRKAGREPQPMQEGDVLDQESVDALNAEIRAMKEADEMGLLYRSDDDWDDESGDVMVEPFEDSVDIARAIYEKAAASDALKFQESWQDKMAGLKILQNAIEKETGHKATGAEDAYLYENRMHGKAKNQSENYDRRYYQPVLKAADAMMKAKGWTDIRQLTDYMVAKHGLERNIFYAFKEAVTGMVRDTINKEQRKLSKRYERGEIDALTYKKEQKELEERLDKDVASKIMEVHNDQRHIDNKADYEAGRKTYSQYIAEEEDIRRDYAPDFDDHYKDYSGLTELTGKDSDYTTEALAMVDDAEHNAYDEERILWDAVNAATKETLRFAYESGTMSRNTYNNVRAMFDYYIPLRGWEEDNADDFYEYVSERNVFSTAVKKAYGRKSLAENPIAYIGNMAVSTLLAGHRNLLKQHFLNYVMNNPTSLVSVSEKWWENKGTETSPYWVEVAPEIPANATADEIADIVEAFNEDMKQKAEQGKATTRRGSLQIAYHATGAEKNEHMVEVQRAGKAYQLYINGNPKAAQALNGINEKAVSRISQTDFGKLIEKINRSMAAFFTSKNPAFVLSNLSRDLTMAGASVAVKEDAAYNRRFIANVFKVLRPRIGKASRYNIYGRMTGGQSVTGLLPSLMRKYLDGDLDLSNETERLFGEFMDEGAETGFVNMLSVDSFKEKMQKEIARMQGTTLNIVKAKNGTKETPVGKGLRMMGDIFEFYNRCAEDATRFIVYMTSRQMGKSLEDSIADAKDVTLNFNRKGTGAQWNAVVRDLFIFVNPAIQALSNMFKMAYKHPLKMTAVTAAFMAGGAMMPVINQWLLNLFGDDDDKDTYWNLPAWVRKNNLVMWVPGTKNFVTIPLAQEFRVFYGLGEMATSLTYDHPVHEWPMEILSSFMDLIPINPTGNGGNLAVDLTPTTLQPLMQLHDNVDFTGKPIWKENQGNKYAPMYTKAYITTPEWMVSLSEAVNDVTGGNEGKKGWAEENLYGGDYINNPAVWNHLMQGYFGGMYNTIAKGFDVITTGAKGELPKIYQTPVVNRFLNRPVERDNAGVLGEEYYKLTEERDRLRYELRTWQKKAADGEEGAQDRVDEIMESDDYQRMLVIDHYDKIMKDLKAGEKAAATDADKADIKESITMYKAEMLEELAAIDGGEDPLAAAKRKFDEAKTFAEKNRLRVRIERLTGRDVRARKGDGRNDEVRKALSYREDDDRESRKVNEQYLELATAENIADDARIRAARLRIKAVTDEAKRLQREGRAEEAIRYQKQHSREINTGDLIESMTRTMNSNKKFLGKGHDEAIMKLIDANRRRMLKAIDDLE